MTSTHYCIWKENWEQPSPSTPGVLCVSGLWGLYHSTGFMNWGKKYSNPAHLVSHHITEALQGTFDCNTHFLTAAILQHDAWLFFLCLSNFLIPSASKPGDCLCKQRIPTLLPGYSIHVKLLSLASSPHQTFCLTTCCHRARGVWKGCSDSQRGIYFLCSAAARNTMKNELVHAGTYGA